jgi:pimeloyl-ACP methyl ester carboxylesterase
LWKIDGYLKVANHIKSEFKVWPGENYFEFPYDWRRDNRVAARKLAVAASGWLRAWRESSGNQSAKLILVGHSMGGLVSRHYLECLEGWRNTRMLVTFGTPYRGSLNALNFLVNGFAKKLGPFKLINLSTLLRSLTSVYQLLPVYPCVDVGGPDLVRVADAKRLPKVDMARATAARAFHEEIREAVASHLKDEEYRTHQYLIRPVVGVFQPTLQSARLSGDVFEILRTYKGEDQDGDGTVPRISATPYELGNNPPAMYASERHGSLQNFDSVLDQLTAVLSGIELDLSTYFVENVQLKLDLEDVYTTTEQITIRSRPTAEPVNLNATIVDVDTGTVVASGELTRDDGEWHSSTWGPLAAGAYRVTVGGDFGVDPVTDVFAVMEAE